MGGKLVLTGQATGADPTPPSGPTSGDSRLWIHYGNWQTLQIRYHPPCLRPEPTVTHFPVGLNAGGLLPTFHCDPITLLLSILLTLKRFPQLLNDSHIKFTPYSSAFTTSWHLLLSSWPSLSVLLPPHLTSTPTSLSGCWSFTKYNLHGPSFAALPLSYNGLSLTANLCRKIAICPRTLPIGASTSKKPTPFIPLKWGLHAYAVLDSGFLLGYAANSALHCS